MASAGSMEVTVTGPEHRAKAALYWTAAAALAAVAVCLCLAILDGRALVKAQFGVAQREADKTRVMVREEIQTTRTELLARVDALGPQVRSEARGIVQTLDGRAGAIQATADARLASIEEKADKQLTETNRILEAGVRDIRGDMRPVFAEAHETLSQASGTIAVLRPQALGLMAASKVTAGESAQAARRFDAALPQFLAITTRTANNVERMTRPSSWWITGLKIGASGIGGFIGSRTR